MSAIQANDPRSDAPTQVGLKSCNDVVAIPPTTNGFVRGCYAFARFSRFPVCPSARQRLCALALLIAQIGITLTGSIVRVTASGLGCPTWPECQPGSLVPVSGSIPWVHQLIEFGNRTLTFVLTVFVLLAFLAVSRAQRRSEIIVLAFIQGIGVIVQAIIGGISVHLDLAWWMVALHFLPSMVLIWLAALLWVRIDEPDDGCARVMYPQPLRWLALMSAISMGITLISGTMVTGAGPHAGDSEVPADSRLQIPLDLMAHMHAHAMYLYLGLVAGLLFGLLTVRADRAIMKTTQLLVASIIVQACVGIVQYWLGVPRWTVPVHVVGSGVICAVTGVLWAQGKQRTQDDRDRDELMVP
ncbi:heme A synthase [Corynebacterium kroppenstedtii]|uniref:COX15/CtaA family protein n=1 Tax=Corynebacterium sp. PCR 32 TaxID=3351342 RepID=UPI003096138D